jgi:sugar/nucleoside kinase (ribokinase family)
VRYARRVIVVVGAVHACGSGDVAPAGLAAGIAVAAVEAGARVELAARIGDDPAGDALLLALAASSVGHVATLRDASRRTPVYVADDEPIDLDDDGQARAEVVSGPTLDGADVNLALRYLSDYRVIVAAHPSPDVLGEAIAAAGWAGAHLVVALDPAAPTAQGDVPGDALILAVEAGATGLGDPIGRYAAAVDAGQDPAEAFALTLGAGEPIAS